MQINPIGNKLLIKLSPIEGIRNGIILTRETREQSGIVLKLGTKLKCDEFKVGQKVYFMNGEFTITDKENEEAIISEDMIIGYAEEEE